MALGVHAGAPALAHGPPDLSREAVRTLTDNAIKHTPEGHLAVAAGTRNGEVWVAVGDSGPGVPPRSAPTPPTASGAPLACSTCRAAARV